MHKEAFLLKVRGRVTGVGFRWATLDKSSEFKTITGYVRNICSGEVEVFVQGTDKSELNEFIEWLKKGPPFARVDSIEIIPSQPDDSFSSFEIR